MTNIQNIPPEDVQEFLNAVDAQKDIRLPFWNLYHSVFNNSATVEAFNEKLSEFKAANTSFVEEIKSYQDEVWQSRFLDFLDGKQIYVRNLQDFLQYQYLFNTNNNISSILETFKVRTTLVQDINYSIESILELYNKKNAPEVKIKDTSSTETSNISILKTGSLNETDKTALATHMEDLHGYVQDLSQQVPNEETIVQYISELIDSTGSINSEGVFAFHANYSTLDGLNNGWSADKNGDAVSSISNRIQNAVSSVQFFNDKLNSDLRKAFLAFTEYYKSAGELVRTLSALLKETARNIDR